MIKFEHTLFALPFALISMLLASRSQGRSLPEPRIIGGILLAMVGARSAAMAFNRIADARIDALNPRTAIRAIPTGQVSLAQAWLFTVTAIVVFEIAAWWLNPLCLALSPVALLAVLGYSYTKRFTPLCHLFLGFGIGIAPIGAWVAVTGRIDPLPVLIGAAVMLWIAGFDIIYALQDAEFDTQHRLRSLPQSIGKPAALMLSRFLHLAMLALLLYVGIAASLHVAYFLGLVIVTGLIAYEHSIVSPSDLSRVNLAFFTLNGWVSVLLFAFVIADRLLWR